jgi:hypothetical protein
MERDAPIGTWVLSGLPQALLDRLPVPAELGRRNGEVRQFLLA